MISSSFTPLPAKSPILCITELCYDLDTKQSHCCLDIKTSVPSPEPSEKKSLEFKYIRWENNYFLYSPKYIKLTVKSISNTYHNKKYTLVPGLFSKTKAESLKGLKGCCPDRVLGRCSVPFCNICAQESQALETGGKVWSDEDLPSALEDQVREHVEKQTKKRTQVHGACRNAPWELSSWDYSWLVLKGNGSWGRFLRTGRKQVVLLSSRKGKKKNLGNFRPIFLTLIPG